MAVKKKVNKKAKKVVKNSMKKTGISLQEKLELIQKEKKRLNSVEKEVEEKLKNETEIAKDIIKVLEKYGEGYTKNELTEIIQRTIANWKKSTWSKVTPQVRDKIKALKKEGNSQYAISKMGIVSLPTVKKILKGEYDNIQA